MVSALMASDSRLTLHEMYMQRCLGLAKLGMGLVAPNPMVGAILVYEGRIIGEGYHQHYGEAHAELNCIRSVKQEDEPLISRSTLYVSLEPCVHYGKTPPCADLIIEKEIPEVVIGCRDPFKKVNGKGIEKLRAASVKTEVAVLEKECTDLNKRFFTFQLKQRPYIILKWAQTANGKIAGEDRKRIWISNEYSNRLVHKWRTEEAAVLVGTNTALYDDPRLSAREWGGSNPVRLVLDMNLRLPHSLKLFDGAIRTIVFNQIKQQDQPNLRHYRLHAGDALIPQLIQALYQMDIQSVIVEGGARLLQSFIDEGCWDEARIITNETFFIPAGVHAPVLENGNLVLQENYFSDSIRYYNR